jgi:hypothetical protein
MMSDVSLLRSGGETWGPVSADNVHETGVSLRACPRPGPILESQALKSWIACLTAGPMWNQSDREPRVPVLTGRRNECQVSGMI